MFAGADFCGQYRQLFRFFGIVPLNVSGHQGRSSDHRQSLMSLQALKNIIFEVITKLKVASSRTRSNHKQVLGTAYVYIQHCKKEVQSRHQYMRFLALLRINIYIYLLILMDNMKIALSLVFLSFRVIIKPQHKSNTMD